MHDAFFAGRRRRGGDGHVRLVRHGARRVRHRPQGLRAEPARRRDRPRGGVGPLRRRPPALRRRLHGAGHQAAVARPHRLRRAARRLRGAGPRPARRRRRPAARRDLLRPAAGQGGHRRLPPGHGRHRPVGAASRRRSPSRPRAGCSSARRSAPPLTSLHRAEARRPRPQLRHRATRDDRAHPVPGRGLPGADLGAAQRRPAVDPRRPHPLRPHARRPRRAPRPLRHRARRAGRRRLLRHDAGAHRRRDRGVPRPRAGAPPAGARAVGGVDLLAGARSTRTRRSSSSASARTPTAPRPSATRCWPATGTRA